MYIGYMGDVVFVVSDDYLLTPSNLQRSASSRWAQHDLILSKPVSQFTGPGLEEISFDLQLIESMGVDPLKQLQTLRRMRDTGAVFPLIIGGRPVTQNYWRIDSLSEGSNFYSASGKLIQTKVNVKLVEYDDSNYVEELSMVDQYGTAFNVASSLLGGL